MKLWNLQVIGIRYASVSYVSIYLAPNRTHPPATQALSIESCAERAWNAITVWTRHPLQPPPATRCMHVIDTCRRTNEGVQHTKLYWNMCYFSFKIFDLVLKKLCTAHLFSYNYDFFSLFKILPIFNSYGKCVGANSYLREWFNYRFLATQTIAQLLSFMSFSTIAVRLANLLASLHCVLPMLNAMICIPGTPQFWRLLWIIPAPNKRVNIVNISLG